MSRQLCGQLRLHASGTSGQLQRACFRAAPPGSEEAEPFIYSLTHLPLAESCWELGRRLFIPGAQGLPSPTGAAPRARVGETGVFCGSRGGDGVGVEGKHDS